MDVKKSWILKRIPFLGAASILVLLAEHASIPQLPAPRGPFVVARTAFHWTDSSRPEPLSSNPQAHRELMVYVWYPGSRTNNNSEKPALYLPGASAMNASGHGMSNFWGSLWPMIASNQIQSRAFEEIPVAQSSELFPLIVFSPGLGLPTSTYTVQIEDLVSSGYVVAAVERTYETAAVVFPDGRVIPGSPKNSPPRETPGASAVEASRLLHVWEQDHYNAWSQDIRFVLDQLGRMSDDQRHALPFLSRINLSHVGALGHSAGGLVIARACQIDRRIEACLNEDGRTTEGPIVSYEGAHYPSQPFMWLRANHSPSDEALARHHYTRERYNREIEDPPVKELESCKAGSYRVTINTHAITHMSFSDKPFLTATANHSSTEAADALNSLNLIESYARAFFDMYLKDKKSTLLSETASPTHSAVVDRYGSAK